MKKSPSPGRKKLDFPPLPGYLFSQKGVSMKKIILSALLLFTVLFVYAAEKAPGRHNQNFDAFFAPGKWNKNDFYMARSPRPKMAYLGEMIQEKDHIINKTPPLSDEEIFKKHCDKVYACMMYKGSFSGRTLISSKMSFDHRMAPLIVLAAPLGKCSKGMPELREHFEIVLYDKGINVWHHEYKDGKPSWYKIAFLETEFKPKTVYDLKIDLRRYKNMTRITVKCNEHSFGFDTTFMPKTFYTGITGCEGRCRFYDFKVRSLEKKRKAPAKRKKK